VLELLIVASIIAYAAARVAGKSFYAPKWGQLHSLLIHEMRRLCAAAAAAAGTPHNGCAL
jgi:hypothetical protein